MPKPVGIPQSVSVSFIIVLLGRCAMVICVDRIVLRRIAEAL